MRNLIHKVLRESVDTPEWYKKYQSFSREQKIEFIEKYKQQIEKLLPKIIQYYKVKLGDDVDISVDERKRLYKQEDYMGTEVVITFKFKNPPFWYNKYAFLTEAVNDLYYYFNINLGYSGVPLSLVYESI